MTVDLDSIMREAGAYQWGTVETSSIRFSEEVRKMCEVNTCGHYGGTWVCPPAVGTVDECRERCNAFDTTMIFSGRFELEDSYDFEGITLAMKSFQKIADSVNQSLKSAQQSNYLLLSNEGCDKCEKCTYPDAPCRFPEESTGSIEGYGMFVSEVATSAGINYTNGADTVTFFGALLYNAVAKS